MKMRPLNLYWSGKQNDNFVTATKEGREAALGAGYKFQRTEGWVMGENPVGFASLAPRELKHFWNGQRSDNFSTAAAEGETAALGAGYQLIRNDGWVFTGDRKPGPQELTLESFWGAPYNDNITVATDAGKNAALGAGYKRVRQEGFVTRPDMPGGTTGVWRFYHYGVNDNWTAFTPQSALEAAEAGYTYLESVPAAHHLQQLPGTVPLKQFFSAQRNDHFVTASAEGEKAALGAGYVFQRVEAYVFPAAPPGAKSQALKAWWSAKYNDNFLSFSAEQEAAAQGADFKLVRTEGFITLV